MEEILEQEMDRPTLERVIGLVHKFTGITMSDQKKTLLQGRLRRRMRALSLFTYNEYLDYIAKNKDEVQAFINSVTTNETSFFRTERVWNFFQNEFLPDWYKKNPGRTLKVWSAASSSGEEAYTIIICCLEFKLLRPDFNFKISASDISTDVLKEAIEARYVQRSVEHFRNHNKFIFDKYLRLESDEVFAVKDELKKFAEFYVHNLFDPPKQKKNFDIVFLRNVLIYFEQKDQEKVLLNISEGLVDEGTLIIGESESLNRSETPFKYHLACVYKIEKSR